ncbi:hypothetical protein [Sphingomonas sp. G-3-2-10]|uniref:hypothetical protein n=1 Tax=Sphingomonas sp. G-3-2-10 TaxID=2728838 RepID=UPI0019D2C1D8
MKDWDDAVATAFALPEVRMESFYGTLCPKLNGKAILSPGREPGSFCLMVPLAEKEMLIETDPDTFWETAHYHGYPAVLTRYGTGARDRIALYIQRRWWDLAKKPQRIAAGMEERP